MATFVLVHGAWHGSWCWRRVRNALGMRGHDIFTPSLTGLADRSHLLSREVTLDTHIQDIVGLIEWEGLADVVLCGHSYGGYVVTGVADRVPERIASLVYLDAFIAEHGKSLHDLVSTELVKSQLAAAQAHGEGWKIPPVSAAYFDVNADDAEWAERKFTMQPLACLQQPIELRHKGRAVERVSYVFATAYARSPFRPFYERAKVNGWRTCAIHAGHDLMLDAPEAVVEVLLAAAEEQLVATDTETRPRPT